MVGYIIMLIRALALISFVSMRLDFRFINLLKRILLVRLSQLFLIIYFFGAELDLN